MLEPRPFTSLYNLHLGVLCKKYTRIEFMKRCILKYMHEIHYNIHHSQTSLW